MVTVIKKGKPIREMIQKLNELVSKRRSGLEAAKYSGILKSKVDPLAYQKSIRNEWE